MPSTAKMYASSPPTHGELPNARRQNAADLCRLCPPYTMPVANVWINIALRCRDAFNARLSELLRGGPMPALF